MKFGSIINQTKRELGAIFEAPALHATHFETKEARRSHQAENELLIFENEKPR